tara:strand:+ start:178 stop:672 length:495 start_codon:yes stop_codon:yes gene_type:complete
MECNLCLANIPKERKSMGYTICVDCSTEEKKMGHVIYPHKTGGYVQVVDSETYQDLNRIDRRGYKGKGPRQYKDFVVNQKPIEEKKSSNGSICRIKHMSYDTALKDVMDYYNEWGYDRTIKYLRGLSSGGNIPLTIRVKLQDIVTDRYINPTPRSLIRKFNNRK